MSSDPTPVQASPDAVQRIAGGEAAILRRCRQCGNLFRPNRHQKHCHAPCTPWTAYRERRARQAVMPGEARVERRFRQWIATRDGQVVALEVARRARRLQAAGVSRYGIAPLWEAIRYDAAVGLLGEGVYRLNNDHRAPMARHVGALFPELAGFFTTRRARGLR